MEIICGLGLLNKKTTIYKTGGTSTDKISYGETCPSSIEPLTDGLFFLDFFSTRGSTSFPLKNGNSESTQRSQAQHRTRKRGGGGGGEQLVWFSLELEKSVTQDSQVEAPNRQRKDGLKDQIQYHNMKPNNPETKTPMRVNSGGARWCPTGRHPPNEVKVV